MSTSYTSAPKTHCNHHLAQSSLVQYYLRHQQNIVLDDLQQITRQRLEILSNQPWIRTDTHSDNDRLLATVNILSVSRATLREVTTSRKLFVLAVSQAMRKGSKLRTTRARTLRLSKDNDSLLRLVAVRSTLYRLTSRDCQLHGDGQRWRQDVRHPIYIERYRLLTWLKTRLHSGCKFKSWVVKQHDGVKGHHSIHDSKDGSEKK